MKVICSACGVKFSSPVLNFRRRDGKDFYCPNGHGLSFRAAIEADRIAEEAKRAAEEAERQRVADEVEELNALYARVPTVSEYIQKAFMKSRRRLNA